MPSHLQDQLEDCSISSFPQGVYRILFFSQVYDLWQLIYLFFLNKKWRGRHTGSERSRRESLRSLESLTSRHLICLFIIVCVVCMCVGVFPGGCSCDGQRLRCLLLSFSVICLRQHLSLKRKLEISAGLNWPASPWDLPVSVSQFWGHRPTPPCLAFYMDAGIQTQLFTFRLMLFTHWAFSVAPRLAFRKAVFL